MNCIKNERIKNERIKKIMYKKWTYKKWNYKKWTYKKRMYKKCTYKKRTDPLECRDQLAFSLKVASHVSSREIYKNVQQKYLPYIQLVICTILVKSSRWGIKCDNPTSFM